MIKKSNLEMFTLDLFSNGCFIYNSNHFTELGQNSKNKECTLINDFCGNKSSSNNEIENTKNEKMLQYRLEK